MTRTLTNCISRQLYRRGWSDADLAARTGLSRERINRLKNSKARATVVDALLIARAFGCAVSEVFWLE